MSEENAQEQPAPGTVVVIGGGQAAGWVLKTLRAEGFAGRLVGIRVALPSPSF